MRPILQRDRCRACGSDLLDHLASGEPAWECGACGLASGRDLVTGEAASVFASNATDLEALVERHLANVQMLVERSEHLDAPPKSLPG